MPGDWKRISPGEPLVEGPFRNVQALCDLRNALPLIADVVEAAERVSDPEENELVFSGYQVFKDVAAALTALRDALEEK